MSEGRLWDVVEAPYRRPTMAEVAAIPPNGLTAVSSFSGCGGSSLGLRMAGWFVPYAIEFVAPAADTYEANAPGAYVDRRDIRKVEPVDILRRLGCGPGELDLFEGSPPCASWSVVGLRDAGWERERKYSDAVEKQRTDDLFEEWTRVLAGLMPRAFLAENVPGMVTGQSQDMYAWKTTERLSKLGYRVSTAILNSASYGVPQERRRLIFVGIRDDIEGQWEWPGPTVTEPVSQQAALASVAPDDPDHAPFVEESSMEGYAVGRAWEARMGLRPFDEGTRDYFSLRIRRPDQTAPTLTARAASRDAASVAHPTECRKFTPSECKALSGFPADFVLTGTRAQRVERMGRAVTPPLYEALGRALAAVLTGR